MIKRNIYIDNIDVEVALKEYFSQISLEMYNTTTIKTLTIKKKSKVV